ncbi:MAG: asparagine synthase (glutamine-hydrolyzing) [Flavobacteriales bacterium]
MCGISGIISKTDLSQNEITQLKASVSCLTKRGPDSNGTFVHQNIGVGHARLSIMDTSSAASQPFIHEDGHHILVFNGEIYNFKELRAPLEKEGVKFRTHSDTEVLLEMYRREKERCIEKFVGFFAFAILDKRDNSVFIARDRFGIKPLYIYQDDQKILFASELKSIMAFDIKKEINFTVVYQYLQFNYIPGNQCIFKNAYKLKPGHFAVISDNKIESKAYYTIPYNREYKTSLSYADAQKKLVELLEKSVERRMIADVPLGAFLSGGTDSSIITALASKQTKNLNTFSIGYQDEPLFDETAYAQEVAKKFNTHHTVFKLTNKDLFDVLYEVLDYTDEPFADSSALAVYILSRETRKKVTVALSGDGADELFSGYNKHKAEYLMRHPSAKNAVINNMGWLWKMMPQSRNSSIGNKMRQLDKFASASKLTASERYWSWAGLMNEHAAKEMLKQSIDGSEYKNAKSELLKAFTPDGDFNEVLLTDMNMVLEGDMLTKVDRMSMANSLEVRVPFLDHEVVNFVFSLPEDYKICPTHRKRILQDTFKDILPERLYKRPKHGFEVPLLSWFRTDLKWMIHNDLLSKDFIEKQGIFNPEKIEQLKAKLNSSNPQDATGNIWALIVFQYWWKKWIN